jgi:hypothetical protein
MSTTFPPIINTIADVIRGDDRWEIATIQPRYVQACPKEFAKVMAPIGSGHPVQPHHWLSLKFWMQSTTGGLGVFWISNPVSDEVSRNAILTELLLDPLAGFDYKGGSRDWRVQPEIAFAGKTISDSWWRKGHSPDLNVGRESVKAKLAEWSVRVAALLAVLGRCHPTGGTRRASSSGPAAPTVQRPLPVRSSGTGTTAPIAVPHPAPSSDAEFKWLRSFRAQPHFTSIFEIYPNETRMYGTQEMYGDWDAELLLMAKDAGSSRIFLPRSVGGRGWRWTHDPSRPTNRNLEGIARDLGCPLFYASFLGPLLRNDDQESGPLTITAETRVFIERLFVWTVRRMSKLKTVAVLGNDAWRELAVAAGVGTEASRWKERHLSGQPLSIELAGKKISLFALNHPARIPAATLRQQPGWKRIVSLHGRGEAGSIVTSALETLRSFRGALPGITRDDLGDMKHEGHQA